jgi:hypothetical protein
LAAIRRASSFVSSLAADRRRLRTSLREEDCIQYDAIISMKWCNTMRLATITVATALGLGTVSIPTVGMAFGNHNDGGGNQFAHRAMGHRFHKHKTLIVPYPYYDYGYPTDDEFSDYPPPSIVPPLSPSACHRNEETFTVPSEGGGSRKITIINCP